MEPATTIELQAAAFRHLLEHLFVNVATIDRRTGSGEEEGLGFHRALRSGAAHCHCQGCQTAIAPDRGLWARRALRWRAANGVAIGRSLREL